jgi:hypothetical protein
MKTNKNYKPIIAAIIVAGCGFWQIGKWVLELGEYIFSLAWPL